jgi:hypothetical protein
VRTLARGARGLRRALHSRLTVGLLLASATIVGMFLGFGVNAAPSYHGVPAAPHTAFTTFSVDASSPAATAAPAIQLGAGASPAAICYADTSTCSAGTGTSRVTLTASATSQLKPFWPDVQVAFVIETTAFDGDFDHYNSYYGQDPCATATSGQGPLCEESNGVPFFIQNAGSVAQAIAAANPHSNVTFALIDFFGTDYDWNDGPGDSWKYNVDIASFVPASVFGGDVHATFQANQMNEGSGWGCVCGLDDNFLHSSSITALYGTIIGSGLDWSLGTHHVIVLMGSAAPRDPNYKENYWASSFDHCCTSPGEYGSTCEPSYVFASGTSPNCEGWVRSQDGNPVHSIAALTKTSPTCTDSVGGACTVDVISYWDTPTDPYSQGWPTSTGYNIASSLVGPGGSAVVADSANILLAACDLAAATGGSWDGPAYWTCPNGNSGSLQYVAHGAIDKPNTYNPTLFSALRQISFGPVYLAQVANGTTHPMFTWVPPSNFQLAPLPAFTSACVTPTGFLPTCQTVPTIQRQGTLLYFGWNWSTNHSQNAIFVGDYWTASFNVINTGPPYARDPVLACVTVECKAAGSGAINGVYSSLTYSPPNSTAIVTQSFPLAEVTVIGPSFVGPPPTVPPAPPPIPPGIPIVITPATPVLVPTITAVGQGIGTVSLNAAAAGFLGAGFMRVGMKNRPIAMRVAALSKNGKAESKFEREARGAASAGIGKFE